MALTKENKSIRHHSRGPLPDRHDPNQHRLGWRQLSLTYDDISAGHCYQILHLSRKKWKSGSDLAGRVNIMLLTTRSIPYRPAPILVLSRTRPPDHDLTYPPATKERRGIALWYP